MTDAVIFKNNASSRLGIPIPAASITITVEPGTGARFPSPAAAQFFPVIVQDRRTDQFEIMYCTQRINDILTVTRAQEGTVAQDFLLGASVWSTATAATWATYFAYSWSRDEADARYVNATGDTMTGLLALPGNPVIGKHATTKEWVEALVGTITSVVEAPNDGLPYARQSIGWVVSVRKVDYDTDMATIAGQFATDDIDIAALQAKDLVHDAAIALRLTDAPNNANFYGRQGGGWQIVVSKVTYDAYVASNDAAVALRLTDAPNDAFIYARAAAAWVKTITKTVYDAYVAANDAAVALRLTDAPNNGNEYVRKNGLWSILGAALTDAPSDGFLYGRLNAVWTKAATLVNAALTGIPTAPTAGQGTNTTQLATTAFALAEIAAKAVRYDAAQALTAPQQLQVANNITGLMFAPQTLTVAQQAQVHTNLNDVQSVMFKSAAYTMLAADRNKLLYISGACTITLTAGTLGNDYAFDFKTTGGPVIFSASTGTITDGPLNAATITIPDGYSGKMWCDSGNWHVVRWAVTIDAPMRGQLFGMQLSNDAGDLVNDINISIGECSSVQLVPVMIKQASAVIKRLDAAWTVGNNGGGLDTGAIANNTYNVYAIYRSDTGVSDYCFSASSISPTVGGSIPAAYDHYRRIGSVLREGATIIPFIQDGDDFWRAIPVQDVNSTNPGTAAGTRTLSVPFGVKVNANISVGLNGPASATYVLMSSLDVADQAPTITLNNLAIFPSAVTAISTNMVVRTNASAQIRSRLSASGAGTILTVNTLGWCDHRGRF